MPARAINYYSDMSFSKINLPGFLIADLYKNSLVELATSPPGQKENVLTQNGFANPEPAKIKFLGENARNIVVLVDQPGTEHIYKADLTFLTNVLKACSLAPEDIAIVNIASQPLVHTSVKEQFNALRVILFDVSPSAIKLPFTIPDFQPQDFGGVTFLTAPALAKVNQPNAEGRLLKTGLWTSLRKIFEIK